MHAGEAEAAIRAGQHGALAARRDLDLGLSQGLAVNRIDHSALREHASVEGDIQPSLSATAHFGRRRCRIVTRSGNTNLERPGGQPIKRNSPR